MNSRSKYKTKQKDILLEYLKKLSGSHVTACDVCDYFKEIGIMTRNFYFKEKIILIILISFFINFVNLYFFP